MSKDSRDYSQETAAEIWGRTDPSEPSELAKTEGQFIAEFTELSQAMSRSRHFLQPENLDGERQRITPPINYGYYDAKGSKRKTARVFAFMETHKSVFEDKDSSIILALDPDTSDPARMRIGLSEDGIVVDLDDADSNFGENAEEATLIKEAVNQIVTDLHSREEERRETWRHRRNVAIGSSVAVGVVAGIGGVVYASLEHWKFGPEREEQAARRVYDKTHHDLPGTSIKLGSVVITGMPSSEFDKIPTMGDGDDLSNPRIVEVTGNDCTEIGVDVPADVAVVGVLEEDDPLTGSILSVAVSGKHHIVLCVSGKDSPEDNSDVTESELAIQIVHE